MLSAFCRREAMEKMVNRVFQVELVRGVNQGHLDQQDNLEYLAVR